MRELIEAEKMGDDAEKVKSEAVQIIGQHNHNLPALVVFDLDYTLWPFYCEYEEDDMPYLYPQALPILHALKQTGISMAVASRSPTSHVARSFLQTLGITSFFVTQVVIALYFCFTRVVTLVVCLVLLTSLWFLKSCLFFCF